ncbi:MAG TPA: exosortase/archaeosortase family protein [Opitutaceae bacterium]|nr:exosortase/archaeosortase family protein [Opitutaceae bacterium]
MNAARFGRRAWPAILCAAAGIIVFQMWGNATRGYIATDSLFHWWFYQWVNPESETGHAWIVLALSTFLLWRNLRRQDALRRPEAAKAAAALIGGLLVHAVGFIAQQPRISIAALLLYSWGVLALAGGSRWGRAAAFPMAFMVFAIPVNALDTVGFWLRMWVVEAGENMAHAVGIGVVRSGTQLLSPDGRYQYDVAAACSGVRSLMALAALSLFIGYIWLRPGWLRAAMLLISLPLVYAGNVLRIWSIIAAANWGGQAWGDRVHTVMGLGVFAVVIGGVAAAAELIARAKPEWAAEPAGPPPAAAGQGRGRPGEAVVAAAVVLVAAAEAAFLAHRSSLAPGGAAGVILAADGVNPAVLPAFLGSDWMGVNVEATAAERAILPPDTGYSKKQYMSREGPNRPVLLSIVLSGRDRTSIHRPELCLVGQGWTIDGSSSRRFSYPGRPDAGFEATVLHVRRGLAGPRGRESVPGLAVYWFAGGDRIVASQGQRMLFDAWNRISHGRADRWAYVLLLTGAEDGEGAGLARIQSVLDSALPSFQPPVPAGGG